MTKIQLAKLVYEKPVRMVINLPADLHKELVAYGVIVAEGSEYESIEPTMLIVPMIECFLSGDKTFKKIRNRQKTEKTKDKM
jgi:hypothetical protein